MGDSQPRGEKTPRCNEIPYYSATRISLRSIRATTLLWLDAGVLDHLAPFAELVLDQLRELPGRARKRLEPGIAESRLHLRAVDDLAQLGVELRDDVRRRACRRENAGPGIHVEPRHARLVERG